MMVIGTVILHPETGRFQLQDNNLCFRTIFRCKRWTADGRQ
jgi:hypothetical protein